MVQVREATLKILTPNNRHLEEVIKRFIDIALAEPNAIIEVSVEKAVNEGDP